jgi:hypothetical protein
VKKLAVVIAAILGVVLYLHRSVVHEVCVDAAIGLASLAGLCLAAAGVVRLATRGRAVQPARYRTVAQPAAVERPRAARPGDPCAEACGRPATRMFDRWPVCDECGGRLDAAAAHAAGRPDYPSKTAGLAAAYGGTPADSVDDSVRLNMPPVVLNGEGIGGVDMTDFEEAHRND